MPNIRVTSLPFSKSCSFFLYLWRPMTSRRLMSLLRAQGDRVGQQGIKTHGSSSEANLMLDVRHIHLKTNNNNLNMFDVNF